MPTSRNDTRVLCPFYQYDEKLHSSYKIVCEGPTVDCMLILNYRKKQAFQTQIDVYCCEYYKRCEVYQMLMANYEGDF